MSDTGLEKTIAELAEGLQPVKPLGCRLLPVLSWFVAALVYMGSLVAFYGVREDLAVKFHDPSFLFETGLALALAMSAALATAWLAIPDMRGRTGAVIPALALFAVFVGWCFVRACADGFHAPHDGWHVCATHALVLGILPVTGIVLLSRQGATVRPRMTAFMSIFATGAIGWLALRYTCPSEDTGHIFFYHLLPYVAGGGLLAALARRLYRW